MLIIVPSHFKSCQHHHVLEPLIAFHQASDVISCHADTNALPQSPILVPIQRYFVNTYNVLHVLVCNVWYGVFITFVHYFRALKKNPRVFKTTLFVGNGLVSTIAAMFGRADRVVRKFGQRKCGHTKGAWRESFTTAGGEWVGRRCAKSSRFLTSVARGVHWIQCPTVLDTKPQKPCRSWAVTRASSEAGESEELPGSFSFRGYLDTGYEWPWGELCWHAWCCTSRAVEKGRSQEFTRKCTIEKHSRSGERHLQFELVQPKSGRHLDGHLFQKFQLQVSLHGCNCGKHSVLGNCCGRVGEKQLSESSWTRPCRVGSHCGICVHCLVHSWMPCEYAWKWMGFLAWTKPALECFWYFSGRQLDFRSQRGRGTKLVFSSCLPCLPLGSRGAFGENLAKPAQPADHAVFHHLVTVSPFLGLCDASADDVHV